MVLICLQTNLLQPRMLCAKVTCSWNLPNGSGEDEFFKFFNASFEQTSPNDALCQVWLKLDQWFLRKWFSLNCPFILLFPNYLPFVFSSADSKLLRKFPGFPRELPNLFQKWGFTPLSVQSKNVLPINLAGTLHVPYLIKTNTSFLCKITSNSYTVL